MPLDPDLREQTLLPWGYEAEARASVALDGETFTVDNWRPDVALSGLAGSGKDTAAQVLVERHGYTVGKFARPLYEAVAKLDPYLPNGRRLSRQVELQGWEEAKRWHPEVRRLLQVFGTEVGREMFGAEFWVERAAAWRRTIDGPVVWTDTRFPNEVEYVTGRIDGRREWAKSVSCIGLWVHVERPGQTIEGAGHASESSLPALTEADAVIVNDGTVSTLQGRLQRALGLWGAA